MIEEQPQKQDALEEQKRREQNSDLPNDNKPAEEDQKSKKIDKNEEKSHRKSEKSKKKKTRKNGSREKDAHKKGKHSKKHEEPKKHNKHSKHSRSRSRPRKDRKPKHVSSSSSSPSSKKRKPSREDRILKIMHERRNQSRSKSVIRYYQRQQVRSSPKEDQSDRFWDGFQWVPKTNQQTKGKADNERVMYMTLKMRRIQICNIPTGLTESEVKSEVTRFMVDNYLADSGNTKPVLTCTLNEKERTGCIELSSVEESSRMIKLEKMKLLDDDCKIIRMGDQVYSNIYFIIYQFIDLKTVTNPVQQSMQQAHNMAQAQAAAINALNNLGSSSGIDREEMLEKAGVSTNIIKVTNFVTPELSKQLETQEWDDMHKDLLEGFKGNGKMVDEFFVRPYQAGLGCTQNSILIFLQAEAGSLFVVYDTKEVAEGVVQQMFGKRYNGREFRIVFIQERTWSKIYKPRSLLTLVETTPTLYVTDKIKA